MATPTRPSITNPQIIRLVELERQHRGDATWSATACGLIRERMSVLLNDRRGGIDPFGPNPQPTTKEAS